MIVEEGSYNIDNTRKTKTKAKLAASVAEDMRKKTKGQVCSNRRRM